VLLAMLFAQLVIGWTNDYVDRDADARFQPTKPVPSGRVNARLIPLAAFVAGIAALGVAATLGWLPALCVAIGMGSGVVYNFALKPTPLSWAPFVVAFCALPPYVWSGLDVWDSAFVALYPIALPLTVAAHLANSLPDIETDRASGRGSIVVRLGRPRTLFALTLLLGMPAVLAVQAFRFVDYNFGLLLPVLVSYAVAVALTIQVYTRGSGERRADVLGFRMVVAASLFFVGGWLASVK